MDAAEDTRSTTSSTTVDKEDAPTNPGVINPNESSSTDPVDSSEKQDTENEEGDALEEGEILELQAFIPRRQWIEEKITLLESLPSVELFDHLEFLVARSPEPIPGLPTREQLAAWQNEHDTIEHEAEQFDSNDMKRLKKFAKAATQRNLSPADTDLIEITLTTLFALDKLIHLLRARSDTLEFTGLRLTWEEKRTAAWKERNGIHEDLQKFVKEQARWSVSTYDKIEMNYSDVSPSSASRGLLPSSSNGRTSSPSPLASDSTPRRNANITGVSRGARYKFAEDLTRDAGRFTTRYSAVKRNHITTAGKALDKMIEKKNVPEQVLDEQDWLENDTRLMDSLTEFAMDMVTQWKKADGIYGELKKDQAFASALCDELVEAMSHHPTARQDTAFLARSQALGQRLNGYLDLKNPRAFPRPIHPNFLDQVSFNEKVVAELTSEQSRTRELVEEASKVVMQYHRILEAVKGIEESKTQLQRHLLTLESCEKRLLEGTVAPDGDGSPIKLDLVACLEPLTHGAYLALLPHINTEIDAATKGGASTATTCWSLLQSLRKATLDAEFSAEVTALLRTFDEAAERVDNVKVQALAKATHLRDVRRVWAALAEETETADDLKAELADSMEHCKWRPIGQAPVTPAITFSNSPWATPDVSNRIEALSSRIPLTIVKPFEQIRTFLGNSVVDQVLGSTGGLIQYLESLKGMGRLCEAIQRQSSAMFGIQQESFTLEQRMEDLSQQFERARDHLLQGSSSLDEEASTQEQLEKDDAKVAADVATFVDNLPTRVPFLGHSNTYFSGPTRKSSLAAGNRSDSLSASGPFLLPFDTAALDHVVRTDANNISMHLSSKVQGLSKQLDYLRLARLARSIDLQLRDVAADIREFQENLETQQRSLEKSLAGEALEEELEGQLLNRLQTLQQEVHHLALYGRDALQRSLGPIRSSLHQLLEHPGAQDEPVHDKVVAPRLDQSKTLEALVAQACQHAQALKGRVDAAVTEERYRVDRILQEKAEREKLEAEERAKKEEEDRLKREAEDAERKRLEEERLKKEEEDRLRKEEEAREEEARLEALRLAELERQRLEAERLEQLRLEQLRREEEEAARLDAIRLAELEKQRLEAERLEQLQLEELRREEEAERQRQEEFERLQREREEHERLRRVQEEEEARIKREQEAVETLRREQEAARLFEEEARRREREERERLRRVQEEEARIKYEQEAAETLRREQEAARLREEEARQREAEAQAERKRIAAEEEERRHNEDIERLEREENERRAREAEAECQTQPTLQDAFTLQIAPPTPMIRSEEAQRLQIQIAELRARLRGLSLHSWARPSPDSIHASILPSANLVTDFHSTFTEIQSTAQSFPPTLVNDVAVEAELHSLHFELDGSNDLLERCRTLATAAGKVSECDTALSDLLEHIDSYPGEPFETSSSHMPNPEHTPQQKLASRLKFTQELLDSLDIVIKSTQNDLRLLSERERLDQTWQELQEMTADRLAERASRPATDSEPGEPSGRESSASIASTTEADDALSKTVTRPPSKKPRGVLGVHRQPSSLAKPSSSTPPPKQRPTQTEKLSRRTASTSSSRSISGPLVSSNSNILAPTFASRQRTTSTSSIGDNSITPLRKSDRIPPSPVQRLRSILAPSPTLSESSTSSRTPYTPRSISGFLPPRRISTVSLSRSYNGRPSANRNATPRRPPEKKKYVPNKKNKLDVAVGRVVNTLPVHVSVEHVSGTGGDGWEDKSGRYWIGDENPRLCFCRILRSHTVMVRVGGGWVELSKFIKDHYAHLFRLLPEAAGSPPRDLSKEKWISVATLQEAGPSSPSREGPAIFAHLRTPSTPERNHHNTLVPSILLNTPGGTPPRSISSSTGSSPLTPLQFMRRVDEGVPGMGLGGPPLVGGPPFGPLLGTIPLPPRSGSPSQSGLHHTPTPRKVSAKQPAWRF